MSIIMFINIKGGVAKTTSAVAGAECLASSGYRTLVIDAEHQVHGKRNSLSAKTAS